MHLIENYELSAPRVVAFQLKAQSEIRVVSGCLWLTVEGCSEDVWLQHGETWRLPVNGQVWVSAEPVAAFRVAQFTAARQPALRWQKPEPNQSWFAIPVGSS